MNANDARGATILEAMVATAVLLIGAVGAISAHKLGLETNADARRLTRASAIAHDLVDQISVWPYGDPRLANSDTSNDGDLGDTGFAFEGDPPPADHGEADLTAGGRTFAGLTAEEIQDGTRFERFWNVAARDDRDGDGVWDLVRVAVVVRWPVGEGRYRRVVAFTAKANPAEMR